MTLADGRLMVLGGALALAAVVGCSGGGTTAPPPPPPPPPDLKVEPPVVPPIVPPLVPPPPLVPTDLLPPPWGVLGLEYGTTTVTRVDPGMVILTAPLSTAATTTEPLYTAWEHGLTTAGYTAGTPYTHEGNAGEPWSKGDQHISIARGSVDGVAYLYAEDLQKVPESAVEKQTVGAVVHETLVGGEGDAQTDPAPTDTVKKEPTTAIKHGPTTTEHSSQPHKQGTGAKRPGGKKGKGKKKEP